MEIVLHLGQSKTGTTSIQESLYDNRELLLTQGICYPCSRKYGMDLVTKNHNMFANSLAGYDNYINQSADEMFDGYVKQAELKGASRIVLSAEHFFSGVPRVWKFSSIEDYFQAYAAKIKKLKELTKGHQVKFILYLRPPVDWFISMMTQVIRNQRSIKDIDLYVDDEQFFQLTKALLMFARKIECWKEHLLPNSYQILVYETYKNNIVADFYRRLDVCVKDLNRSSIMKRSNQSLSVACIELKKMLNRDRNKFPNENLTNRVLERLSKQTGKDGVYTISNELMEKIDFFVKKEIANINRSHLTNGSLSCASSKYLNSTHITTSMGELNLIFEKFEGMYNESKSRRMNYLYQLNDLLRLKAPLLFITLHRIRNSYTKSRC